LLEAIFGHYTISILIFCGIWAVLALSLNVLTGYAGQVSLGHAAFFGIGAYTSALLTTRYGWPFLPALLGAMLVTAAVGGFLGLPSLRVRHDFLVLATMGVNFVVVAVFKYIDFFGGSMGIINIRKPVLFGVRLGGEKFLLLVLAYLALTIWVCRYIARTWAGLAFHTVRADEEDAVTVAVERDSKICLVFLHCGLQRSEMGGAASLIDPATVRCGVKFDHLGVEMAQDAGGDRAGRPVGAVDHDPRS